MKHIFALLCFGCLLLPSCNSTKVTVSTEPITIEYTSAAAPWLTDMYYCAEEKVVNAEQRGADFLDPQTVDLAIRIGQPTNLTFPAYQIDSEDILVIVHRQNPVNRLTAEEVHDLFTGSIQTWQEINGSNTPVQVWVFSSGEDVQQIFNQSALEGSPVTSTARLATGMEEMAQAIAKDVDAVGVLPRHWNMGNVSDVFSVATVPVLVLTPPEPQEAVQEMLACLQK